MRRGIYKSHTESDSRNIFPIEFFSFIDGGKVALSDRRLTAPNPGAKPVS